jgi:hypothetical protein
MKNWLDGLRSKCTTSLWVKSMKECLYVKDSLLEENKEPIIDFGFFEKD